MLCIKTFVTSDADTLFKKGKIYNIIFENKKIHAMSEQQYSVNLTHDDIKECFIYMTNSENVKKIGEKGMKVKFGKLQQIYFILPTISFDAQSKRMFISWWNWAIFIGKKKEE